MKLDRTDARLLDLLQRNNRLSSEILGAKVGLSASGVQRRLKRLRALRGIEADVSIISPKAIGRNVTLLVLVSYRQILVTARPVRRRRLWADGQSVWR
ncbi:MULTISPECIES: AsnC family transcriptional regulator [Bradyrhizobium]|uniref:AsnC family transcriptional regulator n=1 Tax=Bradyrhizobium TaxID=374 RepID=UPI00156BD059|nr:AsnC family transcriptional regulator [Bradyrhizobium barranii]